jgi:hypothetical protein
MHFVTLTHLRCLLCFQSELEYSDEYRYRIDCYLAKNELERKQLLEKNRASGKASASSASLHSYSLEDYGLTKQIVESTFKEYIDKYDLAGPAK